MVGSDAIVEMLIKQGVEVVFGVPGDTSMHFHDAFARRNNISIKHITCRDERNASYMADGYARVKGKPGIVEVPSGGGILYAVPGISEANESFIPLICISSDITMSSEDTGALTDVQQVELTKPITKWNCKIKLASKIPQLMRKAFRMAVTGRPGAIHISVPENIHGQEINFSSDELYGAGFTVYTSTMKNSPVSSDIEQALKLWEKAERPVILAGGGVHLSGAYAELEEFATKYTVPIVTSVNGKGSIGEMCPQSAGVVGANGGSEETNQIVKDADLVLVLGSKLNNVTTMGREIFIGNPKIIQVDIAEHAMGANVRIDLPIMSDIKYFLTSFFTALSGSEDTLVEKYRSWNGRVQEIKNMKRARIAGEVSIERGLVNPARVFDLLEKLTGEETIFVGDAGTPTPYISSHLRFKKAGRYSIIPRSHGSLGYALPAAIGAKVAKPEATVVSLFGDGSFGMAVGDLETARRIGLPVVFINLQNNSYGWIKTIQKLYFEERYFAVDFSPIDAVKIAEGFGVKGKRINNNAELEEGLKWALSQDEPVLLDIMLDSPAEVIPPVVKWRRDEAIPASERKKLTY